MTDVDAPRTRGPRLMVLLVGLAVLPLLGVGLFVVQEYRDVRAAAQQVDGIEENLDELATLDALRIALIAEGNWYTARRGVEELDISVDLVASLAGVDLDAELANARERVDELLVERAAAPYRMDALTLRQDGTDELTELNLAFVALEARIGVTTGELRRDLLTRLNALPDGGALIDSIRSEEAATSARLQLTRLLWTYFRAEFSPLLDAAPDYVSMVRQRDTLLAAIDLVVELNEPGTSVGDAATAARNADDTVLFVDAVDAVVDETFDRDQTLRDEDVDIVRSIQEGARVFRAGVAAMPTFDLVVRETGLDVREVSERSGVAASDAFRLRLMTLGVVALLSILVAIALARYVGRPMVKLGEAATALGSGERSTIERRGPAEVREVSDALAAASIALTQVERLEHLATHDDLTGIPGRRHTLQRLEKAIARATRTGTRGAFMFIDLDDFKIINDTHGHRSGDIVLTTVAGRIGAALRLDDEVGRYGGDEFVVIASSIESPDHAMQLADRVVDALSVPIDISAVAADASKEGVVVSASIGVTLFGPNESSTGDIVRRADSAVYEAKEAGRNQAVLDVGSDDRCDCA